MEFGEDLGHLGRDENRQCVRPPKSLYSKEICAYALSFEWDKVLGSRFDAIRWKL